MRRFHWFLLALVFGAAAAETRLPFSLVVIGPPGTVARGLNDRDEVVGTIEGETSRPFLWDGSWHDLPVEAGQPSAINNLGTIVGQTLQPSRRWKGWVLENGALRFLQAESVNSINDHGDIVGQFAGNGYLLSMDPPLLLTGPTGGPNGGVTGNAIDVSNNKLTALHLGSTALLNRNFEPLPDSDWLIVPFPIEVSQQTFGSSINERGELAGELKLHYYVSQAAKWTTEGWQELGVPLETPSRGRSINELGLIVGGQYPTGSALLWSTNHVGYHLSDLVELPAGAQLTEAGAINNRNSIIATMRIGDNYQAVLLKTNGAPLNLPTWEIRLAGPVITQGKLSIGVTLANEETLRDREIAKVVYTFFRRTRQDPMGVPPFVQPTTYTSWTLKTNEVTTPPFALNFENERAGQYAVTAEIHDKQGLRAYAVPKRFVVAGPSEVKALRTRLDGTFELGFSGSPGKLHKLESSEDLENWTALEMEPSEGGLLTDLKASGRARFYRAIEIADDPLSFGRPLFLLPPPGSLVGHEVAFRMTPENKIMRVATMAERFAASLPEFSFGGSWEYSWDLFKPRLRLVGEGADETIVDLSLQFPLAGDSAGGEFKGVMLREGIERAIEGTFFRSYLPP